MWKGSINFAFHQSFTNTICVRVRMCVCVPVALNISTQRKARHNPEVVAEENKLNVSSPTSVNSCVFQGRVCAVVLLI